MENIVPPSARQILERTLDYVQLRANSNGECFGGEIIDGMREAGAFLGVDRVEVLLTRTVLVRAMESLGANYPAEVLQDYEHRIPVSEALKYLRESIAWTTRLKQSGGALPTSGNGPVLHAANNSPLKVTGRA